MDRTLPEVDREVYRLCRIVEGNGKPGIEACLREEIERGEREMRSEIKDGLEHARTNRAQLGVLLEARIDSESRQRTAQHAENKEAQKDSARRQEKILWLLISTLAVALADLAKGFLGK